MNQSNKKTTFEANVKFCLWIFIFLFWSLPQVSSVSHAEEHTFIDGHNCDVCPILEESSSELVHSSSPFQFLFQANPKNQVLTLPIICFTCICLSNSDPPINL
jgi:hypothetical protein